VADPTLHVLTQANFYRYPPPLYYALLALIQRPLEDKSIGVRLLACRWLSILIGMGLVGLTYRAGHALWPGQSNRALLLGTLDTISNGGIILLHDGSAQTLVILPQIIQRLKARGFRFVTVDQMLRSDN